MVKPLRLLPLSLKVNLTVKYMRCPFARSNCQNILPKIQMEEMKRRDITFLLIGAILSLAKVRLQGVEELGLGALLDVARVESTSLW
uniref:Uncharacterized protein n=1 Tax=Helianthus annuus TaxID=4232 RepID=A0A251S6V9_HELAN